MPQRLLVLKIKTNVKIIDSYTQLITIAMMLCWLSDMDMDDELLLRVTLLLVPARMAATRHVIAELDRHKQMRNDEEGLRRRQLDDEEQCRRRRQMRNDEEGLRRRQLDDEEQCRRRRQTTEDEEGLQVK